MHQIITKYKAQTRGHGTAEIAEVYVMVKSTRFSKQFDRLTKTSYFEPWPDRLQAAQFRTITDIGIGFEKPAYKINRCLAGV